jgi:DivIVA domain-containing protein
VTESSKFDTPLSASTVAAGTGSLPPGRVMRIAPLDLRQQKFKTAFRGFDKTEVVAFLIEAADDYEHALRSIDSGRTCRAWKGCSPNTGTGKRRCAIL